MPLASENARASSYLKNRKLNPDKFYYAERFKHFCNTIKPTFTNVRDEHARIVIPMYDSNKRLIGLQGRALDGFVQPKYCLLYTSDAADDA